MTTETIDKLNEAQKRKIGTQIGLCKKSYDFVGLEDNVMLDAAILAYGDDEVLREKVAIRQQLLPLMEMLFLIDRKDEEGIRISYLTSAELWFNLLFHRHLCCRPPIIFEVKK